MLFSKNPLLYKEWKVSKWVFFLMIANLILFKFMSIVSQLNFLKTMKIEDPEYYNQYIQYWFNHHLIGNSRGFSSPFMLILTVMLSVLLFMGERQTSTCGLLASMPFKRKDIIRAKWIVGLSTIVGAYMIVFIFLSAFFIANKAFIYQPYSLIINWTAINMMTYMAIFSIFMITQSLMGNNFIAGIVGPVIVLVPAGLSYMISDYIRIHMNLTYHNPIISALNDSSRFLNIYDFIHGDYMQGPEKIVEGNRFFSDYYAYDNFYPKLIALSVIIAVCYVVSRLAFEKVNIENIGNITLFPILSHVFKWGVAICLGLFLGLVVGSTFHRENIVIVDIFAVIGVAIGYYASSKAVNLSSNG